MTHMDSLRVSLEERQLANGPHGGCKSIIGACASVRRVRIYIDQKIRPGK